MDFFDHFLKGAKNDFVEKTPRVRWSLLQFGDKEAIQNITIPDFPLPSTDYRSLYLSADSKLAASSPSTVASSLYNSEDTKSAAYFTHTFAETTDLVGLPKIHLFISCDAKDDMDVTVELQKLDKDGNKLRHLMSELSFPAVATTHN